MDPAMRATNPKELLAEWHVGVKLRLLSHYECAKRYDNGAARLGVPMVVISGIATTVSTLSPSDYPWAATATTVVSLLVMVLTGLNTFLRWPELAGRHRTIANQFSVLRRDIEVALVTTEVTPDVLLDFKKRWNEMDANSPGIPDNVYQQHLDRAKAMVKAVVPVK